MQLTEEITLFTARITEFPQSLEARLKQLLAAHSSRQRSLLQQLQQTVSDAVGKQCAQQQQQVTLALEARLTAHEQGHSIC